MLSGNAFFLLNAELQSSSAYKGIKRVQIPFRAFVLALQITFWADLLVKHFSLAIFNASSSAGS